MRYAHLAAITAAREAGAILSFDPNLRFPLWPDREQLRQTVWQFLPLTHILKLSDEELPFLTGTEDIEAALPRLFTGDVQLVLYTCGSKGARAYTRTASAHARSPKVAAVDTTGAGDGFIGSFLWQLQRDGVTAAELPKLSRKRLTEYLIFSNRFCAISVQHHGAIDSYPTLEQMETEFPLPGGRCIIEINFCSSTRSKSLHPLGTDFPRPGENVAQRQKGERVAANAVSRRMRGNFSQSAACPRPHQSPSVTASPDRGKPSFGKLMSAQIYSAFCIFNIYMLYCIKNPLFHRPKGGTHAL